MYEKRPMRTSKSLWKKVLLLAGMFLCLVSLLVYQEWNRRKGKAEYERLAEKQQQEEHTKDFGTTDKPFGVPDFGTEDKPFGVPDSGTKNPEAANGQEGGSITGNEEDSSQGQEEIKAPVIPITNLKEYAAPVMGDNQHLLEERLADWVKEKNLAAASGTIFHVMVPESDPQSIQYFIKLADEKGSLVMLAYHPRENLVTASSCNYTEEEIIKEVWEDNGPANRDVTPEEEAAAQNQPPAEGTPLEGTPLEGAPAEETTGGDVP